MDNIYQIMRDFLKKSGINANEVGNGRIFFSVNGLNFIFDANESDPHFLRLSLPQINTQEVQAEGLEHQIQQLNRSFKVAKIVREQDGSLWIIADAFVYSIDNIEPLFVRLIQALTDMFNDYRSIENRENGTAQKK